MLCDHVKFPRILLAKIAELNGNHKVICSVFAVSAVKGAIHGVFSHRDTLVRC